MTFKCTCGKRLTVDDAMEGQKVRCPGCNTIVTVPENEPTVAVPALDDARRCRSCGKPHAEGDAVCPSCGKKLS